MCGVAGRLLHVFSPVSCVLDRVRCMVRVTLKTENSEAYMEQINARSARKSEHRTTGPPTTHTGRYPISAKSRAMCGVWAVGEARVPRLPRSHLQESIRPSAPLDSILVRGLRSTGRSIVILESSVLQRQ